MSHRPFEYHPEAIREAGEAFHWYDDRSEAIAEEFWSALRRARASVQRHPRAWTPYLFGTRCFKLDRFPFALVYVERGEKIFAVAVAHLSRRPGYWRNRLNK